MSIVNSSSIQNDDALELKIINIIFNVLTAIILGLSGTLGIEEKYQNFLQAEKKFMKLSSKIEQKLLNDEEIIPKEFVKEIMNEYDMIVETIDFDIPPFIAKRVRSTYATKKTLPFIINGIRKDDSYRSPVLKNLKSTSMDEKKPKMTPMESSIIFEPLAKRNKPTVLDIKPPTLFEEKIEGLQECV